MVSVSCAACGKELRLADAVGGTRVPCPQCGVPVAVPAVAKSHRSKTQRALEEAMRAMNAKDPPARASSTAASAAAAATTTLSPPHRAARALASIKLTRRSWAILGGVLAALVVAIFCWNQFTPATWEAQSKSQILQAKQEADQLAAEGKATEAFKKYGSIVLTIANRPVHDSTLKKAFDEAREARVRLQPIVRQEEEKARTAGYAR
jgi:predicted RNA-binding Zn-ribbon protein involved in translation (DUF1610 family)